MSNEEVGTYIGREPCGCVRAAIVDTPERRKEVSRVISEWICDGLTVERVTVGWVREHGFGSCEKCTPLWQNSLLSEAKP